MDLLDLVVILIYLLIVAFTHIGVTAISLAVCVGAIILVRLLRGNGYLTRGRVT